MSVPTCSSCGATLSAWPTCPLCAALDQPHDRPLEEDAVIPEIAAFDRDAEAYDHYLRGERGWLRQEIAVAQLLAAVPALRLGNLQVLDAGGGTGRLALRLARLGNDVRVVDPSSAMLELGKAQAEEAGLAGRVGWEQGTIETLTQNGRASYDLVVAHNVLEYIAEPGAAVGRLATLLRPGRSISVLCSNRLAQPLALARKGTSPDRLLAAMRIRAFKTDLFAGVRNEYGPAEIEEWLRNSGLRPVATRGSMIFAGLAATGRPSFEAAVDWLQLELAAGAEAAYLGAARYIHCLGQAAV